MDRPEIRKVELPESEPHSEFNPLRPMDWVDELIEMTRPGIDMETPPKGLIGRPAPFVFDDFS